MLPPPYQICPNKSNESQPAHQLRFFLPFALRLARIFLPSAVLLRERKP
jgi:hypothetical protein